jgi:hypothetical protein
VAGKGEVTLVKWRKLPPATLSPPTHLSWYHASQAQRKHLILVFNWGLDARGGGAFARVEPGSGVGPGNQTRAPCTHRAYCSPVRETKHALSDLPQRDWRPHLRCPILIQRKKQNYNFYIGKVSTNGRLVATQATLYVVPDHRLI